MLDLDLFIQNVNEQTVAYDPTNYLENELYIERLIKIAELLNKKKKKTKTKETRIFWDCKTITFLSYDFLIFFCLKFFLIFFN